MGSDDLAERLGSERLCTAFVYRDRTHVADSSELAPDQRTQPDQWTVAAAAAFTPIEDERVLSVWKAAAGFLVLTNFRVVTLWQPRTVLELLRAGSKEWHEGPDFFLFQLAPPAVRGAYLELTGADAQSFRVRVANPVEVAATISQELPRARALWLERRARVQDRLRLTEPRSTSPPPPAVREIVRVVVRVPCRYCGALMDEGSTRCPTCGAAQR